MNSRARSRRASATASVKAAPDAREVRRVENPPEPFHPRKEAK